MASREGLSVQKALEQRARSANKKGKCKSYCGQSILGLARIKNYVAKNKNGDFKKWKEIKLGCS